MQPPEMFFKRVALKNLKNLTGKHLYWKETPTQVFSCEICEMFKNAYFDEQMPTAASNTPSPFTLNSLKILEGTHELAWHAN